MNMFEEKYKEMTPGPIKPALLDLAIAHLVEARDQSWAGEANFLVLAFCYDETESRLIRDLCEPKGIMVFTMDLKSWTDKYPAERNKAFFHHDPHPTALTYSIVADQLASFLRNHPNLVLSPLRKPTNPNPSPPAP